MSEKPRAVLFGASTAGRWYLEAGAGGYEVVAFADSDVKKHGTEFCGLPVVAPETLRDLDYDFVVITSMYFPAIRQQLVEEVGIDVARIVPPPKWATSTYKSRHAFEDEATMRLAREVLLFLCEIFERAGVSYFVDHGTLLGLVRDGGLLPWDDDVDLTVLEEHIQNAIACLRRDRHALPMSDSLQWTLEVVSFGADSPSALNLCFVPDDESRIAAFSTSVKAVRLCDGKAVQLVTYAPEHHFKKADRLEFMGRHIRIPYDCESYLEYHYGRWREPRKDISADDVLNFRRPEGAKAVKQVF